LCSAGTKQSFAEIRSKAELRNAGHNAWIAKAERWLEWLWPLQSSDRPGHPAAILPWERLGRLLLVAILLVGLPIAVNRAVNHGVSDFRGFHQASQFTLAHGLRLSDTTFAFYLPSLDVAFEAIAWMPMPIAAVIWYLLGCWSWIALLRSVNRYLLEGFDEPRRQAITLIGGLLVTPLAVDGLCLGSFQTFMVWWIVAGLGRIRCGRARSGGVLLGLAIWIKLLPLLAVAYLILKRKWKPAALAVICAVVLDITLSFVGYGPKVAWAEHVRWWKEQAQGTTERPLTNPIPVQEDRDTNQSLVVILRRTLTTMGINQAGVPARHYTTLLHLTSTQLQAVYLTVVGLLGLAVLAAWRKPAEQLSLSQWSTEIALVSLATLWFSPVIWGYHPTAAAPALLLVLARVCDRPKLFWTINLGWIAAVCLLGIPLAREFGEMYWTVLLLGGLLLWTSWKRPCTP
jgi:hypothetical protein